MAVNWSAEAKRDLADIVDYYEDRSPEYARALVRQIYESVGRLEQFPQMGRSVPELSLKSFRELIVAGYRVVYLVSKEEVDILVIAHSRQDLIKKLSRRR